jgi:hypothetical protein
MRNLNAGEQLRAYEKYPGTVHLANWELWPSITGDAEEMW